jgi:serine protease Do
MDMGSMRKEMKVGFKRLVLSNGLTRLLSLLLISGLGLGCSISQAPKKSNKPLVGKEAAVFDKRFHNLTFDDIDLSRFLKKTGVRNRQKRVPIHNHTIADIVDQVRDGVVNLYTRRLELRDVKFGISPNDFLPIKIPLISALLDIIPFQVPIPYKAKAFSLGSGFIINPHGYILTNAHVITNSTDIRVVLSRGKQEYPAKIIGIDRLTDTALIKIQPYEPLKVLPLGNSDHLRPGEMVIAVGNPLGLRHSITLGVVSALGRVSPQLNRDLLDFIQTDSALNPGSSGGPLINLHGEVVGINTALVSKGQSIGFAIPINVAIEVMPMLVLDRTERGWLGVNAVPLNPKDARQLKYPHSFGILVVAVEKGSPAQSAGIRPKDIIVEMNGQSLDNFLLFRRKLLGLWPGHEIHLALFRDGKIIRVSGTLIRKRPDK